LLVAIDIGGTFTDLMAFDEATGRFAQAKSLTTPAQLVQGIVDCLRKSGVDGAAIGELIHGSTTAINTLIERKGAKTGLIVTRGTRDVYFIGRGNRPESYNLFFHRHRPLVPRHLTREIDERMLSSGEVLEPLCPAHAKPSSRQGLHAPIRSRCWRARQRAACPSWCRFATDACWSRRSPSTVGRP